ncbi:hypothetical protein SteCoe_22478 [Stentor coeruleus]|uniref:Histidine kinase n=1 Tax=Stentor coeruleus TaxID=5963 RepID=A0A1R2BM90_9CILI|nr:hypothetical protein SteCoe_22478 [Stentor coeruleus]
MSYSWKRFLYSNALSKSEWWDEYFNLTFIKFSRYFYAICLFSIAVRGVISYKYSLEVAYHGNYKEVFIIYAITLSCLYFLKNAPMLIKKLVILTITEAMNCALRKFSITMNKSGSNIVCIDSTIIILLFQTNLFETFLPNLLIIVKHVAIWCLFDSENEIKASDIGIFTTNFFIVFLWTLHEYDKRKSLKELHCAKVAVCQAHKQLSELLSFFPDGLLIVNNQLKLKYANKALRVILNANDNDLVNCLQFIKVRKSECTVLEGIKKAINDEIKQSFSLGISDIKEKVYEWGVVNIEWDNQPCCLITTKDVTSVAIFERIAAESRSKSALIRSISHELRTPINGINLILDEISSEDSKISSKLGLIKICTNLLNFQIGDILDYSEIITNNFQINSFLCNLKFSLNECANLISVQAKYKGLNLVTKIDSLIPDEIETDSYRIQKVIMNLLNNAIKYTNKGDIELCAINTGKAIRVSVKDTGIGIPNERLSQLFSMFSGITDNSLGGLGLDVSQKILKKLNSEMKVQSTVGLGSCFTFDLKITSDIPEDSTSWENEIPNEGLKCYSIRTMSSKYIENEMASILIADDNDFNRMCLGNILRGKNIKFEEVANGYDAIEKVLEYDKGGYMFKCVIMDCEMPVMDGWQAAKMITNYYTQGRIKSLPVIIAHTAYSSKEDIQRCYDSGMISYIVKPTPQEVILSIVEKYA